MENQSLKSRMFALTIISFAPILVMVLFSCVVAALVITKQIATDENLVKPFQYAVPLTVIVFLTAGHFYFKSALRNISSQLTLPEKVLKYQSISLIRVAIIEVPGLFGAVAAFLTGYLPFLAAPLFMAVLYVLLRPTAFTIANDLSLASDEKALLEK